jgi:hypothetical protein
MQPVVSPGVDGQVAGSTAQLVAVLITSLVALGAVAAVALWARRNRIWWPYLVVLTGGLTCFMEPMFDHYFGLWFFDEGQWNAFVTYGIHVPVWLPIVYVAYYGCWTTFLIHRWSRGATPQVVVKLYLGSVALAGLAEVFYINMVGLYDYQDSQPFLVAGYPPWIAFVNGVPPFVASLVFYKLIPLLRGWEHMAIFVVTPMCFAVDSFGGSFLYLAARHGSDDPNMWLLRFLAILTAFGSFELITLAARLTLGGPDGQQHLDLPGDRRIHGGDRDPVLAHRAGTGQPLDDGRLLRLRVRRSRLDRVRAV